MECAPIIISVYDRLDHLKKCIKSLQQNELARYSDLFVISDAAYKQEHVSQINEVRTYIKSISGFKRVYPVFREVNLGGHKSVLTAFHDVLQIYDSFISLEDDIVVSSDFLQYMNEALVFYKDEKRIFSICGFKAPFLLPKGYGEDVYFYPCNSPWGIGTWKDRWESVNHDYFDRYSELKKDPKKYKAFTSIGFYIKGILQADSRKEIVAGDLRIYYHMFQHNIVQSFLLSPKLKIGDLMGLVNIVVIKMFGGQNLSWMREISQPSLSHLMDITKNYFKTIENFKIGLMVGRLQNG